MAIVRNIVFGSLVGVAAFISQPTVEIAAQEQAPAAAVSVVEVASQALAPTQTYLGRVTAVDKVDLIARVEGFLERRNFEEGARVESGDHLFSIEKAPYQARIDEAQGDLEVAQGEQKLAQLERDRQATLVERQAVAQAVLDNAEAALSKAKGDTLRAQGRLKQAEIDLGYTDISAPFSGRIGASVYSEGAYVGPNSGTLAILVSVDPIYVTFPVSESELLSLQKRRLANQQTGTDNVSFLLTLADGATYEHPGTFNFANVQVDPGTDTVQIRGQFPNPDGLLVDQALVTVRVQTEAPKPTLVIPQAAIQFDQSGRFVLGVNNSREVEVRRVTVGEQVGTLTTITEGLAEGEQVIVEGIQKVRPGMQVDPTVVPMPVASTTVEG